MTDISVPNPVFMGHPLSRMQNSFRYNGIFEGIPFTLEPSSVGWRIDVGLMVLFGESHEDVLGQLKEFFKRIALTMLEQV